ncbi:hypothetical protein OS493_007664 [Desmophyllum pertusum]|uniref:Uncharacterized protein n=1 Tax=Desmophyllum pertusum TaxID=174260 RepID=A0A9X0CNY2_9CNID|nr:hypothetical protein OS493_007664 [Desmophyllum pertusum]
MNENIAKLNHTFDEVLKNKRSDHVGEQPVFHQPRKRSKGPWEGVEVSLTPKRALASGKAPSELQAVSLSDSCCSLQKRMDFQRIVVTDDESLDTHNNIITQLELERRLPEGRRTCEQLLENVGLPTCTRRSS